MTITPIASSSSSRTVFNPAIALPFKAAPKSSGTVSTTTATSGSSASAPSAPAQAPSKPSHASHNGGGGASAGSSVAQEMQVTSFSTTVDGKQYSGSVSESDGEYVASDPTLSGATATGSSEIAAENNLAIRINELV